MVRTIATTILAAVLSITIAGCSGEDAGEITKEAASEAGKVLKQWQEQNK